MKRPRLAPQSSRPPDSGAVARAELDPARRESGPIDHRTAREAAIDAALRLSAAVVRYRHLHALGMR